MSQLISEVTKIIASRAHQVRNNVARQWALERRMKELGIPSYYDLVCEQQLKQNPHNLIRESE